MKYLHVACLVFACGLIGGCGHDTWSYRAVPDINISRPNELDSQGVLVLKMEPEAHALQTPAMKEWLRDHPEAAGKRTVLMANWRHDSDFYSHTIGQTLVIFMDGAPKLGQCWLNSDNAVLITYSAYSAPSRERVGLVGSITIDRIENQKIFARLAVRDTTEIDTSLFLERPWDPVNREAPFVLRGDFAFDITGPSDPLFEKSAVKWVTRYDPLAVAGRE